MPIQATKGMLQQTYSWKAAGGEPRESRSAPQTDPQLFNRHEGCEVMLMIQKVVSRFEFDTKADVHRIEKLIACELPSNLQSRQTVFEWLVSRLAA